MATQPVGEQQAARKYSVHEIDRMRRSLRSLNTPIGVGYDGSEVDQRTEMQLQTHLMNGTEPHDLETSASEQRKQYFEAQRQMEERRAEHAKLHPAPTPRVLLTANDVVDEWFQTSVAQYAGASAEARDLFDGFSGMTLKRFANQNAPDGVHITQKDMERYLDKKGIRSRRAMFAKRYDGVCQVQFGNVRNGNYGT